MELWIITLTCLSMLGNSFPVVETSPLGTSFGSFNGFRGHQHAEFGEGVRDWFRNVKNRFFGSATEAPFFPPPESAQMILDLENEDFDERQQNHPSGFFVDLNSLTFDTEMDWGFHIGNWYFIRKVSRPGYKEFRPWTTKTYPEWPQEGRREEDPILTMQTSPATSPVTDEPQVPTSTASEVKDENQNSSDSRDQSAEVLLPSE